MARGAESKNIIQTNTFYCSLCFCKIQRNEKILAIRFAKFSRFVSGRPFPVVLAFMTACNCPIAELFLAATCNVSTDHLWVSKFEVTIAFQSVAHLLQACKSLVTVFRLKKTFVGINTLPLFKNLRN